MVRRRAISSTTGKWLLIVLVAVLAIGTIVLTLLALDHVSTRTSDRDVAPVPTFSQAPPQTPSPTPSVTNASGVSYDRSQERFLTVSAGVWWRGTAGECGVTDPLLERSADEGKTWTDFTPHYLGIGQLVALRPFADGQAQIVALMGEACEVQALQTFTQGKFWESYPDVLVGLRYVDPADSGNIVTPDSLLVAPCHDTRSLHAAGASMVTVCDGTAYVLGEDDEWVALTLSRVSSANVRDDEIVVSHVSEQCNGVAITRFAMTDYDMPQNEGCAEDVDPSGPIAIADSGEGSLIWSGNTTALSPR